jgi:DNA recombination protein RmuC
MNQLFIVTILLLVVVIAILFYMVIQQSKIIQSVSGSSDQLELSLHKRLQESFFNFQNSVFGQLEHSDNHSKFVFEELEKSQQKLDLSMTKKLDEIKYVVDEKLHKTLENRLSHSFQRVSDSLEKVQKGLGEMQVLANGVGDLKKVLSNTKSRGVLGEIQLSNILDQLLTQDQYAVNVATIPNKRNHVEFAIKFPGNSDKLPFIWLPIDAKFPMDTYEHLLNAYEGMDKVDIAKKQKDLANAVKFMASEIKTKYIYPPYTTDFGIMFLPTESLYAEVLRIPGLIMEIQQSHKVMLVGPNNLGAFLTSLQQGFKSLAIERRTDDVWKLLGIVRTEFGKFGDVLDKTQKKILEANNIIETASAKSRTIERKLKSLDKINYLD